MSKQKPNLEQQMIAIRTLDLHANRKTHPLNPATQAELACADMADWLFEELVWQVARAQELSVPAARRMLELKRVGK